MTMIKRKFGMACLNITQGRYSNGSHKYINAYDLAGMDTGIDRWRTWNELEVIGVHPYATTGFANTVHFYDAENDVTIAMTHCNTIPDGCVVGHVFRIGDTCYYEGTKGQATGNHIHLEIGKGRQPNKVKAYNGGWGLKDFINIEDYFYIDRAYTTIKSDGGYAFSFSEEGSAQMELDQGYQTVTWNNNLIHVYVQRDDDDVGLVSASGSNLLTALQTIDKIDDSRTHRCKVNAGYFQMQSGQSDPVGTHYGAEQSPTVNAVPRQGGNYLVFWVDNDNNVNYDYTDNYWLAPPTDCKFAITPACIMLADGKDADIISTGIGDKRNLANTQTMFIRLSDGRYAVAVTGNANFNAYNCRAFAKDYGATFLALMDSGGSSQMIVDGKKKVYTGRAIANAITFFTKGSGNVWKDAENGTDGGGTEQESNCQYKALYEQEKAVSDALREQVADAEAERDSAKKDLQTAVNRADRLEDAIESIQSIIDEVNLKGE